LTGNKRELMHRIYGVMQGRLSAPEEGRFQAFPRNTWRDEIRLAKEAGFSYIEWIHDDYDAGANPIFSEGGRLELDALKKEFGVSTPALCGDWFMDFPLVPCSEQEREQREQHLCDLLPIAEKIGARKIVLPFVDNSKLSTEKEKQAVVDLLNRVLPLAERHHVELHLEADFNPTAFKEFLDQISHPSVKVNWDSGNSSGLGYIASEEFAAYGNRIGSVHIKDRYRKPEGGVETRPLGTGSADFDDVFRAIRSIGYSGGLTLQVARGTPGDEVNFLRGQIEFLERYG
jgi:L-ribulose-5-phosphate 3-epimerase